MIIMIMIIIIIAMSTQGNLFNTESADGPVSETMIYYDE